jgi:hypothetical protein
MVVLPHPGYPVTYMSVGVVAVHHSRKPGSCLNQERVPFAGPSRDASTLDMSMVHRDCIHFFSAGSRADGIQCSCHVVHAEHLQALDRVLTGGGPSSFSAAAIMPSRQCLTLE